MFLFFFHCRFRRRTEQLISGVNSDYVRERNYYNSTSNPISHVSFPRAPPSAPDASRTSIDSTSSYHGGADGIIPRGLHLYKPSSDTPSTHENQMIDSGHPSIDDGSNSSPNSPNSPETPQRVPTAKSENQLVKQPSNNYATQDANNKPSSGTSNKSNTSQGMANKLNPFLANSGTLSGTTRDVIRSPGNLAPAPNKIILQPIELPLRGALPPITNTNLQNSSQFSSRNGTNVNESLVPKHLFAARSMKFDVNGLSRSNDRSPLRTSTSRDDLINRE